MNLDYYKSFSFPARHSLFLVRVVLYGLLCFCVSCNYSVLAKGCYWFRGGPLVLYLWYVPVAFLGNLKCLLVCSCWDVSCIFFSCKKGLMWPFSTELERCLTSRICIKEPEWLSWLKAPGEGSCRLWLRQVLALFWLLTFWFPLLVHPSGWHQSCISQHVCFLRAVFLFRFWHALFFLWGVLLCSPLGICGRNSLRLSFVSGARSVTQWLSVASLSYLR